MKNLLFILLLTACAQKGTTRTTVYEAPACQVLKDTIVCNGEAYVAEAPECPVIELPEPVIVEVPADDSTAEPLEQPIAINYHGIICNSIPVVSLNEQRYVIYQGRLNIVAAGPWATVWEQVRNNEVRGCYVKLNSKGNLKSRYLP